ncbi:GGDEF domain-containing protein [Eubacteriaceae bacterium ES3]|nr:GGDEF domain-containing protein [Eubacteriaceae bacterium ES3]
MKKQWADKIKTVQEKFIPLSKEGRNEFYDDIVSENMTRMMIISLIFFIFEAFIMVTAVNRSVFEKNFSWFLLFFHGSAVAIAILYRLKMIKISGNMSQSILSVYCIIFLYWSIRLTLIKASTPSALTMYTIVLAITSTMILRRAIIMIATNTLLYSYLAWQLINGNALNNPNLPDIANGGNRLHVYLSHSFLILIVSCVVGLFIIQLRLHLHREMKQLEHLSYRDSMTMLLNHVNINQSLRDEIILSKTYGQSLCALMLDIDFFKSVNDQHGHKFGDVVIKKIANVIKENSRVTDHVGRYGGEEFLIVMPNTTLEQGYELSERLRQIIEEIEFDNEVKVTVSIGLKVHSESETAEELIKNADEALYAAKNNGRNRVEIASTAC